jgi:probable DNA repair protein
MSAAAIAKSELFGLLARGRAAGIAVVTPNRRVARALAREFDACQVAAGRSAWEDPEILPLGALLERLWDDALHSERGGELPLLLSEAQEDALWAEVISSSATGETLLGPAHIAAQAREAWRLAHAWRIDGALTGFPGNEDAGAFADWAREYRARTRSETDAARLPDLVARALPGLPPTKLKLLVPYAFDLLPPQTGDFFLACGANGIAVQTCMPPRRAARAVRAAFVCAREELEAAARWARARLGSGATRLGVVVPALAERRAEVARVFSSILAPGACHPGVPKRALPFELSLGVALADYPIVRAALALLELAAGEVGFALASRLLRSPFLGEAESEMARRARLDAGLRRTLPARLTLARLVAAAGDCPLLRARLEALLACARDRGGGQRAPRDWAQHFSALLEAAGFPGERALDSAEFQARAKLHEALRELGRLERVVPRLTREAALGRLRHLCEQTLFQPESPAEAPVQVLGILESAGLEFDCLWVSGLADSAWPLAVRPNPFLPVALQRKAGIPEASAERSLALDRSITEGWTAAAQEVVFSHPLREDDRELAPSPLILAFPSISAVHERAEKPKYRDLIFEAGRIERVPDGPAPALGPAQVQGGTRVLADQAACPFRAFARHRLGAEGLESPAEGPDARVRGQMLHTLMAQLWGELKSKAVLGALAPDALSSAISRAATAAVAGARLEGRFAALEQARLERLAREWLELERSRADFEVAAIEQPRALEIGGLTLSGRIDRMDRLADGSHLLLDYKTSRQLSPRQWLGERPDEPQLPLYATAVEEDIGAVAFARLRRGEMRFTGYARAAGAAPGVTRHEGWNALLGEWRKALGALALAFASGSAPVDPKQGLATCRNCGLEPLCRVHERLNALASGDGEGE